jgi:ligand-binding sensor domain-containing protein
VQIHRSKFLIYLLVFAFLFASNGYLFAQQTDDKKYIISKQLISIEDGLAARDVYCGVQDGQGFLWFGTRNGLNRYDGKKFQVFTKRNATIQENNIVKLATDNDKQLFILYGYPGYSRLANGKVDVLNQETFSIQSLTATFKNLPFKEQHVYWIANNGTDGIYQKGRL